MKRLTDKRFVNLNGYFLAVSNAERKELARMKQPTYRELYDELGKYENMLESGQLIEVSNKPLTIEELKALERFDWIYVLWLDACEGTSYSAAYKHIAGQVEDALLYFIGSTPARLPYSDYGIEWLAFKNKEQAEAKHKEL